MHLPEHAPSSLTETDSVELLLPKAIEILQRDFELSDIICDLKNFQGDVYALREQLIPCIERTGGPGYEAFYRLLYRADVPEHKIIALLQSPSEAPIMARISELLIIRALQKAWTRAKFS